MKLSRKTIAGIDSGKTEVPALPLSALPEKVLQFGTGVLLRALPEYFIHKANQRGLFNGSVVVIKSTSTGDSSAFAKQDNLYTVCVRGVEGGKKVEENIINASISRVMVATEEWPEILALAASAQLEIIISNTTEVGIVLTEDRISASPPASFPGKLLAFLYERYRVFKGDPEKGMVIIPTELLPDNGRVLQSILLKLAAQNGLEMAFVNWLEQHNDFCSSLVDRIVPGKMPEEEQRKTELELGYEDELMIMAESYRLWAIETRNERTKQKLSFSPADEGVIIAPDIEIFRELKLRLLNASHTLGCGLAHLAGFTTVKQAMADAGYSRFVEGLMREEIIPVITSERITAEMASQFASQVLDRFRNPYIEHKWLSITMQYASKIRMRDLPLLTRYIESFGRLPERTVLGWAAHILFMRSAPGADGQYYGETGGKRYLVQDNQAATYSALWENPDCVVDEVLQDVQLWGTDLSQLPGFADAVNICLAALQQGSARQLIDNFK